MCWLILSIKCYLHFISNIGQGMDYKVVPPSMADQVSRVLSNAIVHKLPEEGHFSYLFYCDECHRKIFTTLFGTARSSQWHGTNRTGKIRVIYTRFDKKWKRQSNLHWHLSTDKHFWLAYMNESIVQGGLLITVILSSGSFYKYSRMMHGAVPRPATYIFTYVYIKSQQKNIKE